jgi:hypothetical protein
MTMVPGPIPFETVDRYATRFGFEGVQFEELLTLLRALDEHYLQDHYRKTDRKGKKGKKAESDAGDSQPTNKN